jgi:hypothetical protein
MDDNMTAKDRLAAYKALCNWFESQGISTENAIPILVAILGELLWENAEGNPKKAASLADLVHLQIVRHLGKCLADKVTKNG